MMNTVLRYQQTTYGMEDIADIIHKNRKRSADKIKHCNSYTRYITTKSCTTHKSVSTKNLRSSPHRGHSSTAKLWKQLFSVTKDQKTQTEVNVAKSTSQYNMQRRRDREWKIKEAGSMGEQTENCFGHVYTAIEA